MKTAIVTGASGNLGQAVVKKLLAGGYYVTGTVVPGNAVAIDSHGKYFETAVVDLANEDAARQFVELVSLKHGSVDVAILTVGGFAMGTITSTSMTAIRKQFQLNFETTYNVARPVLIQMMKQGTGRIFLVGSKPGDDMKDSSEMVAYGLAKSLVFRMAELMNEEAKNTNVVTSVIVPSTIDTPQNRVAMPDVDFTKWVAPEAIAEIISFYCSNEASALREPVIRIYGGS